MQIFQENRLETSCSIELSHIIKIYCEEQKEEDEKETEDIENEKIEQEEKEGVGQKIEEEKPTS